MSIPKEVYETITWLETKEAQIQRAIDARNGEEEIGLMCSYSYKQLISDYDEVSQSLYNLRKIVGPKKENGAGLYITDEVICLQCQYLTISEGMFGDDGYCEKMNQDITEPERTKCNHFKRDLGVEEGC